MIDLKIEQILPNGDCGLLIKFKFSEHLLVSIHALAVDLLAKPLLERAGLTPVNVIPATDSLALVFSVKVQLSSKLMHEIERRIQQATVINHSTQTHEMPVCYDPAVASDISAVCALLKLSHEELITYHSDGIYQVDMLGFLPGFSYLSGNHSALHLPRKDTPKLTVEAGSVAIAGNQTGIYSLSSPGGWHVIGQTPASILNWNNTQQPMRFRPLDKVKFKPISLAELNHMSTANGY